MIEVKDIKDTAQEWLDELVVDETNQYYVYEINLFGVLRKGYAKLSDDKKFVTVAIHMHKNKWAIIKESVSAKSLHKSPKIQKSFFEYAINQNLRNI